MKENETIKLTQQDTEDLNREIDSSDLSEESKRNLKAALRTLGMVCATLEEKRGSIERLRKLLFGETEKLHRNSPAKGTKDIPKDQDPDASGNETPGPDEKKTPKNHRAISRGTLGISPLIRTRF